MPALFHQHIQPAQFRQGSVHEPVELGLLRRVGANGRIGALRQRCLIDVGHERTRTSLGEAVRNHPADPARAAGNRDPQSLQADR